ncbi:MAG: hypothetical protein HKP10_07945, partial [Kiritimatiellales bacterium]|nr:hypothetical protein [Kiritimatiellales bacterium]
MLDQFSDEQENNSIFESFSDIALCTLAVALLLVTLLAINITQNLNIQINRSKFSGGVMRPSLHLECTVPDFGKTTSPELALERALYAGRPYVAVHLFSPSLAMIATDVREGGTVALGADQTFAQQHDLPLYQFMQLASGIDPGSFNADDRETALLLPSILNKQMVYEPNSARGYRVNANRALTKDVLALLWPIYEQPIFARRRPEEYAKSRTRLYVETQTVEQENGNEDHYIVIGHSAYKVPDALDDGSLAWLGGFSSGLTEIIFLGETWSTPDLRLNKRIEFFEAEGFLSAADAYREYAFPSLQNRALTPIYTKLIEAGYPRGRADERARSVFAQLQVSEAMLEGDYDLISGKLFPPLLAYPRAWQAYI